MEQNTSSQNPPATAKVVLGSYNGKPTITLAADTRYPFSFGKAKAKLIVEHFEAIKAFAASADSNNPASNF